MPSAPTQQSLVDDALALLPTLAQRVIDATHDELKGRPQFHHLFETWQRQSLRLADNFAQALAPMLKAAAQGRDPLQRATGQGGLQSLSLVDDQQALQDVAIAHAINAIEDRSRTELHQLNNFFAALRGIARARKNDNPLRAALFAQAFYEALRTLPLDAQGRHALVQVAATPLARSLHMLYSNLCEQLRQAELSQLVASHAASQAEDLQRLRRAADSWHSQFRSFASTEPATLDGLSRRLESSSSKPQALHSEPAALLGPATLPPGKDLLSRLYDQILADPRLLAPLKARLARVQVAVARLAMADLSLLRRQDHPTWQLLNRVAAHGMGFERADDPRLQEFLAFLDTQIEQLVSQAKPTAAMFEQVQRAVKDFVSTQALQRSEPSSGALAVLEREQMRPQWQRVLREQIDAQLADSAASAETSGMLRAFLRGVWVKVIVETMVREGQDSPVAQAHIELVDALLASLHRPAGATEREQLREALPALVQRLEQGMNSVALEEEKRQAVLDDLMGLHGRLLLGLPPLEPAPQRARELSQEEQTQQRLLAERESMLPSQFLHTRIDRGELPTVPMQLIAKGERSAIDAWLEQLQLGAWYHLFVQSEWITAQITWISETRQYFLFVGQDSGDRHSLTRGAIEQLLANGLITVLDEQSLMQRAVDELMRGLDSDG